MRVSRAMIAAASALLVAVTSAAVLTAQAKTEEDYDKLMKAVGAANGTMAKATDGATVAAEAKKLQALFKDAQGFWTAHKNKEAADWSASAMTHAAEIEKAATANNMEGVAAHRKELGGVCATCHKANREKTETGFRIRPGALEGK
jgi:cytochrome c556